MRFITGADNAGPALKALTLKAVLLLAAGFLSGLARGAPLETCLKRGAIAAAEVISHYGPRPETDMQKLMAEKL